jgi:hypothetical protein
MTNKSKALPSQDSLAGTPSANAMFATIAAVIAASRREDEPRLEEPLSRNRNDIADKICRTFCAAIDLAAMSPYGPSATLNDVRVESVIGRIVLQNSKVAAPRIFRENKKRETITDSYTLSRGAEIAGEFNARGSVPSRLYTEDAPTARRIFDHLCKTTFATQSGAQRTSHQGP